jgi:hypothetical protein
VSTCVRSGNRYKRHKYKEGVCKFCKANQPEELRALAKRRMERKAKAAKA